MFSKSLAWTSAAYWPKLLSSVMSAPNIVRSVKSPMRLLICSCSNSLLYWVRFTVNLLFLLHRLRSSA